MEKRVLRGCQGQREDVEVELWSTQELGNTPRDQSSKRKNKFGLLRIPFHCVSNAWIGEGKRGKHTDFVSLNYFLFLNNNRLYYPFNFLL